MTKRKRPKTRESFSSEEFNLEPMCPRSRFEDYDYTPEGPEFYADDMLERKNTDEDE